MGNLYIKILATQQALKANKDQFNSFGKYSYRSCENILEALKPLLALNQLTIFLDDDVVEIGGRVYVEATATVVDVETGDTMSTKAFAREEETKKGMDASQVTGAASSYARKYALCGLFAIDDNKDSDATNTHGKEVPEIKQDNKFRCEKCGAILEPYEHNGKTVSLRQHAESSRKKFGKVLCMDCITDIKGDENA